MMSVRFCGLCRSPIENSRDISVRRLRVWHFVLIDLLVIFLFGCFCLSGDCLKKCDSMMDAYISSLATESHSSCCKIVYLAKLQLPWREWCPFIAQSSNSCILFWLIFVKCGFLNCMGKCASVYNYSVNLSAIKAKVALLLLAFDHFYTYLYVAFLSICLKWLVPWR